MKDPDPDRERSEQELTLVDFKDEYNKSLPETFPPASVPFLKAFKKTYPNLFKGDVWVLDKHRKKFMDWRPQQTKSLPH